MEGLHTVDPSGEALITLRNPGAPFVESATGAGTTDEGPALKAPAVVGDQATEKSRSRKREKKGRRSRSLSWTFLKNVFQKLNPLSEQKLTTSSKPLLLRNLPLYISLRSQTLSRDRGLRLYLYRR
jgi:hypothetical protein